MIGWLLIFVLFGFLIYIKAYVIAAFLAIGLLWQLGKAMKAAEIDTQRAADAIRRGDVDAYEKVVSDSKRGVPYK